MVLQMTSPIANDRSRQRWMSVLSKTSEYQLVNAWQELSNKPDYDFLRSPETGLIMVRGRAGGVGQKFNLGEMTMTRCSVQISGGAIGHGYVKGRSTRHAELAAVFDALMQDPTNSQKLEVDLIQPLEDDLNIQKSETAKKAEATKVEFFTMVRGEDEE